MAGVVLLFCVCSFVCSFACVFVFVFLIVFVYVCVCVMTIPFSGRFAGSKPSNLSDSFWTPNKLVVSMFGFQGGEKVNQKEQPHFCRPP